MQNIKGTVLNKHNHFLVYLVHLEQAFDNMNHQTIPKPFEAELWQAFVVLNCRPYQAFDSIKTFTGHYDTVPPSQYLAQVV